MPTQQRLVTGWTVLGSNSGVDKKFSPEPSRPALGPTQPPGDEAAGALSLPLACILCIPPPIYCHGVDRGNCTCALTQ